MRRLSHLAALALLLIGFVPATGLAQTPVDEGNWLVTGMIGLGIDADGDPSLTLSGGAAYPLTKTLAVEGELGHVLDMSPGNAELDTSLTTVHGSLLYFLDTEYKLTPYLVGGLGVGKYSVDEKESGRDLGHTEFGVNLGAGVVYPFSGATLFRGDFRYLKHIDQVPAVWRFQAGISVRIGS